MRPILCVIDLSGSSPQVLEVAARMAYAYKSQLTILFPYRLIDSGYKGEISKLKQNLEQDARDKFAKLKELVPTLDQVSFEFQPEIGFAADRISAFIRRNSVDGVVISQRMVSEINHVTMQTLIATSKLPFTIVPEEMDVAVIN